MREATIYYMNTQIEPSPSEESKKNAKRYCKLIIKTIGDVRVKDVTTDLILNRFNLIEKYYANDMVPTGERLRFYLQAILGLHKETCKLPSNAAGWDAMKRHIGKYVKRHKEDGIESKPGVHLEDMGRFLYELNNYQSSHGRRNGALCLVLIYLTGSRPGEGRKAQWREVVGDDWIVPKGHLKKRRKDRAQPITEPMRAVFDEMRQRYRDLHDGRDPSPDDLIFPNEGSGGMFSAQDISYVIKTLKWSYRITAHGARNTIKNWFDANGEDTSLLVYQFDHRSPESGAMKFYDSRVREQVKDPTLKRRREAMTKYCEWCMNELAKYKASISRTAEEKMVFPILNPATQ
jgi:integrase